MLPWVWKMGRRDNSTWCPSSRRWLLHIRTVFFFSCILFMHLYVLPGYLLFLVVGLPLRCFWPALFWKWEETLYNRMILFISAWIWQIGYRIREWGLGDLGPALKSRCLVMVNHQSTADVPLMLAAMQDRGLSLFPKISWIIDSLFRFTNFGFISWIRGDFFIRQGRSTRTQQLHLLRHHIADPRGTFNTRSRQWLVVFPEGGFLYKRRAASRRFALERDLPDLQHVTLPRTGAVSTILDVLAPRDSKTPLYKDSKVCEPSPETISWIIDVTMAYPSPDQPLTLSSGVTLEPPPPWTIHILYRRFDVREVPLKDPEALQAWINKRWTEKETLLHTFYTTGSFYPEGHSLSLGSGGQDAWSDPLRHFSWTKVAGMHLQFICLTLGGLAVLLSLWQFFAWFLRMPLDNLSDRMITAIRDL